MRVLLVYDVDEKRLPAVHKVCRRYLYWVQNSVFEGELTRGRLNRLIQELERVIDRDYDSVVIYTFKGSAFLGRLQYGPAGDEGDFIL